MNWPTPIPVLNPIEHLRDELNRRARVRVPALISVHQLRITTEDDWNAILRDFIVVLVRSMNTRLLADIQARERNTGTLFYYFFLFFLSFLSYCILMFYRIQ